MSLFKDSKIAIQIELKIGNQEGIGGKSYV